jgi:hypothetical protein
MYRLVSLFTATHAVAASTNADPCTRVCEIYSADRLGAGFDLCANGGTSDCYPNPEIGDHVCRNLYLVIDEVDGTEGLIYETNGSTLTVQERSNPLTCRRAENFASVDEARQQLLITNNWNMALHMFVNSAPIQRLIDEEMTSELNLLLQFVNGTSFVSSLITRDLHRETSSRHISGCLDVWMSFVNRLEPFLARLARRTSCDGCSINSYLREHRGMIPIFDGSSRGLVESLRALLQPPPPTTCRFCSHGTFTTSPYTLVSTSEVLVFEFPRTGHDVSLPLILNLTDIVGANNLTTTMYRLYAFAANDQAATFRINDQWYVSNNGSIPMLTTAPLITDDAVVTPTINIVLYEGI